MLSSAKQCLSCTPLCRKYGDFVTCCRLFIFSCSFVLCCSFHEQGYLFYLRSLPLNDSPEIFGLHENANITFAQNETYRCLKALLLLQPKSSSGGGKTREEVKTLRTDLTRLQFYWLFCSDSTWMFNFVRSRFVFVGV